MSATTIPALFLDRVEQTPDSAAYLKPTANGWKTISWSEVRDRVRDIAGGLRALGLGDEERCAILSGTRFEWIAADLGTLCAAGATTTIYPSGTAEDCVHIIGDSGSRFVFAENPEQVEKLLKKRGEFSHVRRVIAFDGPSSEDGWVISLSRLEEIGREHLQGRPDEFEKICRGVKKDSLATLIYTSGTTGKPKGVELTHDCWVYEAEAIDKLGLLTEADVQYLWVPLAHALGKVLQIVQLRIGFKTAVDGRVEKLVENLAAIRPTFTAAVPRVYEKVHARIVSSARESGGVRAAIFDGAFKVGRRVSKLRQQGREPSGVLALLNAVADRLVFSKLKNRFGGRLRFFISGSAPLSRELAEFFHAAGILILEGYGLTESSAATFVNRPDRFRFGSVGPPLPGTEVKISPEDGEILIRGRGLMRGYHRLPEATAEVLDSDGWLHTGDIGTFEDGFLQITDRKKDLIKTSGGKYVAPQAIEGKLKLLSQYVSQVVVHGNNRNFCTALIALDEEAIRKWAGDHGLSGLSYRELSEHSKVRDLIGEAVDRLNADLAKFETIKKFALLPADLTLEAGDLTPSAKLKRKAVEAKYRQILDGFYSRSESVPASSARSA